MHQMALVMDSLLFWTFFCAACKILWAVSRNGSPSTPVGPGEINKGSDPLYFDTKKVKQLPEANADWLQQGPTGTTVLASVSLYASSKSTGNGLKLNKLHELFLSVTNKVTTLERQFLVGIERNKSKSKLPFIESTVHYAIKCDIWSLQKMKALR